MPISGLPKHPASPVIAPKQPASKVPQKVTDYSSVLDEPTPKSTALVTKPISAVLTSEIGPKGSKVEKQANPTIHPGLFTTNGMSLAIQASRSVNLGDYNNAKIGVTLTIPCEPANLEEAYNWGTNWASDHIEKEIKEAFGQN